MSQSNLLSRNNTPALTVTYLDMPVKQAPDAVTILAQLNPSTAFSGEEGQHALSLLGDVSGKAVLNLGCGAGEAAVHLAQRGAVVTACDAFSPFTDLAVQLAERHQVGVQAHTCRPERLPFADHSFDLVYAEGLFYDADVIATMLELHRVLKPGGRAVFIEPIRSHPKLSIDRSSDFLNRVPHQRPLTFMDQERIRAVFPSLQKKSFRLTRMARLAQKMLLTGLSASAVWRTEWQNKADCPMARWDTALLERFPVLEGLCWTRVFEVTRP